MEFRLSPHFIEYQATGKFSSTVTDYLAHASSLRDFYLYEPTIEGIHAAIEARKNKDVDRQLLTSVLSEQYASLKPSEAVQKSIELLQHKNTFTICTAHQPNIFTGHLYFIYKILHAIKLADTLSNEFSEYNFVPVFFIGSEDADLDELNHIELEGKKYVWNTKQKGAVGRMVIDKDFISLIQSFEGRILAEPHGTELMQLVKESYVKGRNIQDATLQFVHNLFSDFGLIILMPDNAKLKKVMEDIFKDDLLDHNPSKIVNTTSAKLSEHHHAQAFAREINLFYLKDDIRNRIVPTGDHFVVHDTDISFTKDSLLRELNEHPERFSPNVILRGLFQVKILPDIAFIGGGGELAYWLQLKELFVHYQVPYPVLFLRNSFLIIQNRWKKLMDKTGLNFDDLFKQRVHLIKEIVQRESRKDLNLEKEEAELAAIFDTLRNKAGDVDPTLTDHVEALKAREIKNIKTLQTKMVAAEKKNMDAAIRQINKLLDALNADGLQERTENFMLFYAMWGKDFLKAVYDASPVWEPEFCILTEE